jgi:chitinase
MKRATRTQLVAALAAAIVVVLGTGTAFAFWQVASTGSGNASTDTLAAPVQTNPTNVTSTGAQINWTPVTTGWQKDATYTATVDAGSQTCNAAASVGSCSLSGLVSATTYTVTLTATFSSWNSAASNTKTVAPTASDTTAPSSTISFPANATAYNTAGWTAGCNVAPFNATNTICGAATDNAGGSGVKSVAVSVQATSSGKYWDPSSPAGFKSTGEVKMAAAFSSGNWTLAFPTANLTDGTYSVRAYATDNANNTQASATLSQFTYDATAPTSVAVTAPVGGASVSGTGVTVTGTGTDANLASIQLQYKLHTASTWTNIGTAGTSSPASATWNVSGLTDGSYDLQDVALDTAGNQTTSATVTVTVANAAQPISLVIANKSTTPSTAGKPEAGDTIAVTFSTPLQTATMCSAASWASPAGDTTSHTLTDVVVTYTKGTAGNNDSISFGSATCSTFRFGTVQLDAAGGIYSSGSTGLSFTGSTLAYSYSAATGNSTVTVTLGALASGTPAQAAVNHTATWTATNGLKGTSGSALSPTSKATTAELF